MKKSSSKFLSLLIAFCMTLSCVATLGTAEVSAASKPSKVKKLKATVVSSTEIDLKWAKVKGAKGYRIYRNNKKVTDVKTASYADKNLQVGTKYTYKVKAYKTTSKKQYYNSKKKKWVGSKPKKSEWKGKKTKKVTKKILGPASSQVSAKTKGVVSRNPLNYPAAEAAREQSLATINACREANGLEPLKVDPKLQEIAQRRADWMNRNGKKVIYMKDIGGDSIDMIVASGLRKIPFNYSELMGGDVKSFGDSLLNLPDIQSLPFGGDVRDASMNYIGIGYNCGYMDILLVD